MERRALKLAAAIVAGLVLTAGYAFTVKFVRTPDGSRRAPAPDATVSQGQRIKVQVMNATTVRGLARRATLHLRDRGFDVVEMGTSTEQRDSTLVLDRSGHPDWAQRVAEALGGARVESRRDTSRYLDVTVLIGRTWRPPAEPFHP